MNQSQKNIKSLEEVVEDKLFIIPSTLANDKDSEGNPCIVIGVGGEMKYIPTGVFTKIPYKYYCALHDVGFSIKEFEDEFNPLLII